MPKGSARNGAKTAATGFTEFQGKHCGKYRFPSGCILCSRSFPLPRVGRKADRTDDRGSQRRHGNYSGSEVVERTNIRAGLIKFASDYHVLNDNARKIAEAVAAAHLSTGAPILTHCERGTCAMEQVELFAKLGVHPSCLLVSHLDRNLDFYVHEDVAHAGAYLVYDGMSRVETSFRHGNYRNYPPNDGRGIRPPSSIRHGHGTALDVEIVRRRAGHDIRRQRIPSKTPPRRITPEPIHAFTNRNPTDALAFRKYS